MAKEFGKFNKELGSYTIEKLPEVGSYEYIYKNDEMLVKVDQFGIITAQIDAPVGEAVFKREERETCSPVRIYFCEDGKAVYNNFDVYRADKIKITYSPEKAVYVLLFGETEATTELFVTASGRRFVMNFSLKNLGGKPKKYSVLKCAFPYLNPLLMAPWDKPEWYTRTEFLACENAFLTTKFSVAGKKEERRFLYSADNAENATHELSIEKLVYATKDFTVIPSAFEKSEQDVLYAFKQCMASVLEKEVASGESFSLNTCFFVSKTREENGLTESRRMLLAENQAVEFAKLKEKYAKLFDVRRVKTSNFEFDKFVNGFLPLEMYWVASLDRGWPTGMRGVRDAANDFEGMLCYDGALCREVIENIFSKQRSDGWYPRQVPFGGDKFDLRHFVDSACFFTEYVYDYIAYTDDYSVLEKNYGYYDSDIVESGFTHLKKGIDYLLSEDALGEHGLVKMRDGDWLDCLSGVGKQGKGETVMVTCQLIMCIDYLCQLLNRAGLGGAENYAEKAKMLKDSVNKYSFNGEFYNAVYTDRGNWLFSDCDEDGERRVYIPTNAYAVISGVAEGKEDGVFKAVGELKTTEGYKLFSKPIGEKYMEGLGKMGTGDFQPYFAENGSVYNHGSQCFLIRALAKAGRYSEINDVLGYAMPVYSDKHAPEKLCVAPYAVTNCYHLVPNFYGRAGFSFLTGSVAMIMRAVYSWIFGIGFELDKMVIAPCVPSEYADAEVVVPYGNARVTVRYSGYGSTVVSAELNGKTLPLIGGKVAVDKSLLGADCVINVALKAE